jgi:hypothetical protein
MTTESNSSEPKVNGNPLNNEFRAILIGSRGRLNGRVFSNKVLREILRRQHLQSYEAQNSDARKTEVILDVVKGRYRFYKKRNEKQHVSMDGSVSLDSLLRDGHIAQLPENDESERRIVCYLKKMMRQIRAESSRAARASKRLKKPAKKDSNKQRKSCRLPPGTVFVSDCTGERVYTPASAECWPGVEFGRFNSTNIQFLEKAKRGHYPQIVKNTKGLQYDNCGQSPGLINIFPSPINKETAKMALELETDILLRLQELGYDMSERVFYANRLGSSERGILQQAHVDLEEPEKFLSQRKAKCPIACLFPTSVEGCYLQVWPSGSGYGKIIRLELGEILFFMPCLVHAGGLGEGCPRVQAYITNEEGVNSFTHTTQYMRTPSMRYSDFCFSCVEKITS